MTHRPQHGEVLVSAEEVTEGIRALAAFTVERYGGEEEKPLFVALLRGGGPFAWRLMAEIVQIDPSFHPELDIMVVSTYRDEQEAGTPVLITDIDVEKDKPAGRHLVMLDDMLDEGITASFAAGILMSHGAETVDLAVLTTKDKERAPAFASFPGEVYSCFPVPKVWATGMGMDHGHLAREGNRHLPYIAVALDATNRG